MDISNSKIIKQAIFVMVNVIFYLSCLSLTGCTTLHAVNKNYNKIDRSNGINIKEAVFIAQKYCLQTEECRGKVRLSTPDVHHDEDRAYYVNLWSKNISTLGHVYIIEVDRETGEVINASMAN